MEYAKVVAGRYLKAGSRKQKTKILDEFCATAGYHRKHAVRKLGGLNFHDPPERNRSRERLYSAAADALLIEIWEAYGCICGERLHPFLAEGLAVLERCGHVKAPETVKREVLTMSTATASAAVCVR